jgi:hypothetical protein
MNRRELPLNACHPVRFDYGLQRERERRTKSRIDRRGGDDSRRIVVWAEQGSNARPFPAEDCIKREALAQGKRRRRVTERILDRRCERTLRQKGIGHSVSRTDLDVHDGGA